MSTPDPNPYAPALRPCGYWVDSEVADRAWIGRLPNRGHFVYRLYGHRPGVSIEEDIALIYVGVTDNLQERLRTHSRKWWWVAVVPRLCQFNEYASRAEAEADESAIIWQDRPAINRAGRLLVVTEV